MAKKPRVSGSTQGSGRKITLYAALALGAIVVAVLVYMVLTGPKLGSGSAVAPPAATGSESEIKLVRLNSAMEFIERMCLSGYSDTIKNDVKAKLSPSLKGIGAEAGSQQKREILRGAINELSDKRETADTRISTCMNNNLERILDALTPESEKAEARANPLKTYFVLATDGNADPSRVEIAKLRLKTGSEPIIDNSRTGDGELIVRRGGEPFWVNLRLPRHGDKVDGTLVPDFVETRGAAPSPARLCFELAKVKPAPAEIFARFDCSYGGQCRISESSPAWLADTECEPKKTALIDYLVPKAFAQSPAQRWALPSIENWENRLKNGTIEGVGLTQIDIETDAFRDQRIYAVDVSVTLNGTPVLIDGLVPGDRPVRNDPGKPFRYAIGFRSLDLQGSQGGCDALAISLMPRGLRDARPLNVHGDVVALRPLKAQTFDVPGGKAKISGIYRRPGKAYEMQLFIDSAYYARKDWSNATESGRVAMQKHYADFKKRFDRLGLSFEGKSMVAVVRPPLRNPAYGVAVGLVNERGQVSFTFPKSGGTSVAAMEAYLLEQRALRPDVARLIQLGKAQNEVKLTQYTVGTDELIGLSTPPGICRPFAMI